MTKIIINGCLLGFGLAMDAFSVSLANGLNYPKMHKKKMLGVASTFAVFQGFMPLIGWFLVTRLASVFNVISPLIPWAALALLLFIGGKMLIEGLHPCECEEGPCPEKELTLSALMIQGIATSIDALSVGLTIADLTFLQALLESGIIALLTFFICAFGIYLGKKFGMKLSNGASILGGGVLIAIGFKIFFFG